MLNRKSLGVRFGQDRQAGSECPRPHNVLKAVLT